MKRITIHLLASVLSIALIYAAFAFIKAETNPFTWSEDVRAGMIFTTVMLTPFVNLLIVLSNND